MSKFINQVADLERRSAIGILDRLVLLHELANSRIRRVGGGVILSAQRPSDFRKAQCCHFTGQMGGKTTRKNHAAMASVGEQLRPFDAQPAGYGTEDVGDSNRDRWSGTVVAQELFDQQDADGVRWL